MEKKKIYFIYHMNVPYFFASHLYQINHFEMHAAHLCYPLNVYYLCNLTSQKTNCEAGSGFFVAVAFFIQHHIILQNAFQYKNCTVISVMVQH